MSGFGTAVLAADYNSIQAKIAGILGVGSGQSGYGQTVLSSQVTTGNTITGIATTSQWAYLREDLRKARRHQTGNDTEGNALYDPVTDADKIIRQTHFSTFNSFADTVITNKFTCAANKGSLENVLTPAVRSSAWNGTLTNTVTINFPGATTADKANNARYFFNAGGNFQIFGNFVPSGDTTVDRKNDIWKKLITNAGRATFNYTQTVSDGPPGASLSTYNIGWYNLTTTNQLILNKQAESLTYSANRLQIYARRDANSTQCIFEIQFQDLDTGSGSTTPPSTPIDENVTGTLTSTCQMFRPSGVGEVTITAPTATQAGF